MRLETSDRKVLQVFEGGGSAAQLEMRAPILDSRRRRLLGARTLSASAPASSDPAGGVAAANVALASLMDELASFVTDVSAAADCGNGLVDLP